MFDPLSDPLSSDPLSSDPLSLGPLSAPNPPARRQPLLSASKSRRKSPPAPVVSNFHSPLLPGGCQLLQFNTGCIGNYYRSFHAMCNRTLTYRASWGKGIYSTVNLGRFNLSLMFNHEYGRRRKAR